MAMITLECPHCGARLQVESWRSDIYCEYCDSTFTRKPDGGVAAGNDTSVSAQLTRAFFFLEDGDFARADEYLEKVLDADPHCARAYMGKLLCKLKLRHMADLKMSPVLLTSYELYNRALRFANEKEDARWRALNDEVIERRRIAAENARRAAREEAEGLAREAAEEVRTQELWQRELATLQQDLTRTELQYQQMLKASKKWTRKQSVVLLVASIVLFPLLLIAAAGAVVAAGDKPTVLAIALILALLADIVLFFGAFFMLLLPSAFKSSQIREFAKVVRKKKAYLSERSAAYHKWMERINK